MPGSLVGGELRHADPKDLPDVRHTRAAVPADPRAPRIPGAGAEVLSVLTHSRLPLTVAQVQRRPGAGAAYSTVRTILNRLHAKGPAARMVDERCLLYAPVERDAARALPADADRHQALALFMHSLDTADKDVSRVPLGPLTPAPQDTVIDAGGEAR